MNFDSAARRISLTGLALIAASVLGTASARAADGADRAEDSEPCGAGETLATGETDPAIFSREASRGVRAFWCETYDANGSSLRAGPYWELYPDGAVRTRARYVAAHIEGAVEVFDEDGSLWLRGKLVGGGWTGTLELFHPNGAPWLTAQFRAGQLDGSVETRFPDGSLESSTRFQRGREDGIATSYYPARAGGALRSQVHVEADEIIETLPQSPAEAALSQAALPGSLILHSEN